MIRITRQGVVQNDSPTPAAHHYSLGGQRVVFQSSVEALSAYSEGVASDRYSEMLSGLRPPAALTKDGSRLQYQGEAPFAGELQAISCYARERLFQINVNEQPLCTIDIPNKHIHLFSDADFDDRLNLEVVTGPALMLALAARGVYTLHAGAVACSSGAMAFMAESGIGKSTLSENAGIAWQQYADDMLPLIYDIGEEAETRGVFQLQSYPQLKLEDAVAPYRPGGKTPLHMLVRLSSQPSDEIAFKRLQKTEALLQIIRHTVAAKLFDNDMMRSHARFAKRLTTSVPVIEVLYPRDLGRLDELRAALMAYAEAL